MAENITNELIYEVLKSLQENIRRIDSSLREIKDGQIHIREDINSVRGDVLRHDKSMAGLEVDIERIKNRLDLNETPL